jgi:hypothetical protein
MIDMPKYITNNKFWKELIRLLSSHYLTVPFQLYRLTTVVHWFQSVYHLPSLLWLISMAATMGPSVPQVWLNLSYEKGLVAMVTKLNP